MTHSCAGTGGRSYAGSVGVSVASFEGAALGQLSNGTSERRREAVVRMALKHRRRTRALIS